MVRRLSLVAVLGLVVWTPLGCFTIASQINQEPAGSRMFSGTRAHIAGMTTGRNPFNDSMAYWEAPLKGDYTVFSWVWTYILDPPLSLALDIAMLPYTFPAQLIQGDFEGKLKPAFKWDPEYASKGTSLEIKEQRRVRLETGTEIFYRLQTGGFAPGEHVYLWHSLIDAQYTRTKATITDAGLVLVEGATKPEHTMSQVFRGQALDVAIESVDGAKRAQAQIFPFPIRAHGTGGTSAEVRLAASTGHLFAILMKGFSANEKVQVTSRYKHEVKTSTVDLVKNGDILHLVVFGPGDHGTASLTAKGTTGAVTVHYGVGRDALKVQ